MTKSYANIIISFVDIMLDADIRMRQDDINTYLVDIIVLHVNIVFPMETRVRIGPQ